MARRPAPTLRPVTLPEQQALDCIRHAPHQTLRRKRRAQVLRALAAGAPLAEAARRAGYRGTATVAALIRRFNTQGLAALDDQMHSGGTRSYTPAERARILREFARPPDPHVDGTSTWSLATLQRALRRARDGLPQLSSYTIARVLKEAGYTWRPDRKWGITGPDVHTMTDGTVCWSVEADGAEREPAGGESPGGVNCAGYCPRQQAQRQHCRLPKTPEIDVFCSGGR